MNAKHVPIALEHTSRVIQSFVTLKFFTTLSEPLAKVKSWSGVQINEGPIVFFSY